MGDMTLWDLMAVRALNLRKQRMSFEEIGRRMCVSRETARRWVTKACRKWGVSDCADLRNSERSNLNYVGSTTDLEHLEGRQECGQSCKDQNRCTMKYSVSGMNLQNET